ncbi:shikimate kinase [Qipengyuania qiaonensis]|uniref:Shikimate kinase n=1 Tax=Qipengyuania qiaonensis TaxID=2867240 RepID=A0ABS7J0U1_9SPHN|nr:shikimate kinase [Qipengyuania qiaonensis]MBX7480971.1 shikimate kinase [Qipengyuania qiaonensis]
MTHATILTPAQIDGIARRIDRPVVLVGLMGVGKSTVGRRLANMLQTDFVDVDDEIERAADRTISEIFETHGEAYFRDGERRVIARLMDEAHGIIATGGGAFVDSETRALILGQAIAIWLDCDIDTLVERTSRRDNRPLLRTGDPREILSGLKDRRRAAYAGAQIHVITDNAPHTETAQRILEAIDAWL